MTEAEFRDLLAYADKHLVHLSSKAAEIPTPPGYTYDRNTHRYRRQKGGQFVSEKTIFSLLDTNEQAVERSMNRLSSALLQDTLSESEWFLAMDLQLRRLYVQNAALGAGGFGEITPVAFRRLNAAYKEDRQRLVKFGEAINNGSLSESQIQNRIKMYVGSARVQYWKSIPKPKHRVDEIVVERRVLGEAEKHCSWCVHLADLGWQPWGLLPEPGESSASWDDGQCLSNCRCKKQSKAIKKRRLDKVVTKKIGAV